MACTPEKQFPGAWPESPLPAYHPPIVMDYQVSPPSDSLPELRGPPPSRSGGSATLLAKKPPALRIVVPPTEYCPFSTDLSLPITPLSLPTPVSSSCFTFSDTQELVSQSVSAPPTPAPVPSSCSRDTAIPDVASPTSSQFLLMPPTPHAEDVDIETVICVLPLATSAAMDEPMRSGSNGTKSENPRSLEASSSTWLSNFGGHTETDRIFRHNLLDAASIDTASSPASTPALSPSVVSPSSQISSTLAYNLPTSPARSPAPLSPRMYTMYPQSFSPTRLVLKPTGTDTFPSTLDSLQAWRESVTPGFNQSEEPHSPLSEDVHNSRFGELMPEAATPHPSLSSHQRQSYHLSRVPRVSKSRVLIKHAKIFGGRVKQLVTRKSVNKHRSSMDRGVSFKVVTSQDSENGSVILITAPPPPYDVLPSTFIPHSPVGQEHVRPRAISECSSAVQANAIQLSATDITESGSRQGGSNRNALRRLSLAALSTIKRF